VRKLSLKSGDYRWPRKGDKLVRDAKEWKGSARFSEDQYSRDAEIWSGYMRAPFGFQNASCDTPEDAYRIVASDQQASYYRGTVEENDDRGGYGSIRPEKGQPLEGFLLVHRKSLCRRDATLSAGDSNRRCD
jgi:hypothetical protein